MGRDVDEFDTDLMSTTVWCAFLESDFIHTHITRQF